MLKPVLPSKRGRVVAGVVVALSLIGECSLAQQQFINYFNNQLTDTGDLGGFTFDADGNLWTVSFQQSVSAGITRHVNDGNSWSSEVYVSDFPNSQLRRYRWSPDVVGGVSDTSIAGNFYGTMQGFLLNPAPLEIEIPLAGGGTTTRVYQPGELGFIPDNFRELAQQPLGQRLYDAEKLIHRYDLRKQLSPTNTLPDLATAQNASGAVLGSIGTADWNDIFAPVATRADFQAAADTGAEGTGFAYNLAWSSDGQSLYGVYSAAGLGGLYRIDATQSGQVTQVWAEPLSGPNGAQINGDPAVIHTSQRRLIADGSVTGDQIVVEGSSAAGNDGGINVFFDPGGPEPDVTVTPLLTRSEFERFSDFGSSQTPTYTSFTFDDAGNLYFAEGRTDNIYLYDTQGRMAKIASRREHNLYQFASGFTGNNPNDSINDLQTRPGTTPEGFAATEVIFSDYELEVPVGIYAYQIGDFDRDDDLDADDLTAFAAALGTRNSAASHDDLVFDLNGDSVLTRNDENEIRTVPDSDGGQNFGAFASVVDWKDVKILQQFAEFPNGDTNFDMTLDLVDLTTMSQNYYTEGQTAATWVLGDFASADPDYLFDASDANLVDSTDLQVLADAWLNDLGLPAPSESVLQDNFDGQFLTDAIAAFAGGGGLIGDYDLDGDIDEGDYDTWAAALGLMGSGLAADGNGDGVVDAADYAVWRDALVIDPLAADFNSDGVVDASDYTVWRDSLGQTGDGLVADANGDRVVDQDDYQRWVEAYGAVAPPGAAVPEPSGLLTALIGGSLLVPRRK